MQSDGTGSTPTSEAIAPYCPDYHRAVEVIGSRWTPEIVRALLAGTCRFSSIAAAIPGLSDRMLSRRLKLLESEGLVRRDVTACTPVRIEYHLTAKGAGLADTVQAISAWAERWAGSFEPEPERDPAPTS